MSSLPDLQQLCKVDCIFPIVDGVGGEDGSLQGLLSFVRRPVVGSPLLAAAQAYNKWTAKQVVAAAGVPVTKGIVVNAAQSRAEIVDQLSWTFRHWDLIVKPVSCGSSFGVSRTWSAADLDDALSSAFAFDHAALVEEYIEHVEIYVGVLSGEAGLIVAPPAADAPGPIGYSTYTDKYIDIEAPMDCPSKLEPKVNQEVMELAVTAFNAIGCTDFARLDFFYSLRTKSLLFNELNTMPAMAPYCAFPTVMRAAGLSYERMVETLVGAAIKRYAGSGSRYPVVPRIEERKVA
jgi:D-alanine-D-alanine ligase